MDELGLIAEKLDALAAANEQIDRLETAGQLSADSAESMRDQNQATIADLRARRETLRQTGQGVTPILSEEQATALSAKVRRLQQENLGSAALRALLLDVLTFAENLSDSADSAVADATSRSPIASLSLQPATWIALAVGVGIGMLTAQYLAKSDREKNP